MRRTQIARIVISALLVLVALGGLVGANIYLARHYPGGQDFLVHWAGARAFLFENTSPYDEEVGRDIQTRIYGRPAAEGEYPFRLDDPLYILVFFFPFALIPDFAVARGLWMMTLEIALAGLAFLALRLADWRPRRSLFIAFLLFALLWFYGAYPLFAGDTAILVALLFAGILLALRARRDDLAGLLLAFTTFKWEVTAIFLLAVAIWVLSRRRWRVIVVLSMTLAVLLVTMSLALPGWPLPFYRSVVANVRADGGLTPGAIFIHWWPKIGDKLGWALTILLALTLFLEWRAARASDFRRFYWTLCLTLAVAPLLGIPTTPANFTAFLLPLTFILAVMAERWLRLGLWLNVAVLLLVFIGPWVLFWRAMNVTLHSLDIMTFLPVPLFLLIALYWLRWWAIRPSRTWLDGINQDRLR